MSQKQQDIVQRFLVALAALRAIVDDRGYDNDFTFDEIWNYTEEKLDSKFRSNQANPLVKNGYIVRTARRQNARSRPRRGSRVDVYEPGPRLKRDKMPPILFYRLATENGELPSYAILPCMSLSPLRYRDEDQQIDVSSADMNDTYRTAFTLRHHGTNGSSLIGIVKILQRGDGEVQKSTSLPSIFAILNDRFISLGQSLNYYEKLKALGESIYEPILSGLNDVVFYRELGTPFEASPAWRVSLLRFSEAEKAYREARQLFYTFTDTEPVLKTLQFTFTCQVPGADSPHTLNFNFQEDTTKLNRIAALIGRNGTGKTQVLAKLANAVSGLKFEIGSFNPRRPSFSKVIAISYSIFDEFERPSENGTEFSYVYCGIRYQRRLLEQDEIRKRLFDITLDIKEGNSYERWKEIISTLLDGISLPRKNAVLEDYQKFYDGLSSGQRILILVISQVIKNISEDSIILFDEPELHLHPEAIAALTRALHKLLDQFKSYAIIATHSPIILQEIPARFVTIFRRQGNYPIVSPLMFESFGENLSNITDEVFETTEERYNYREHLRELVKYNTYKEILEIFDNRLSFNARAFLGTLYRER